MSEVLIIDYGMGNLGSVRRAFEELGANVTVTTDPKALKKASHVVLPGVGAFGDGIAHLREHGWVAPIQEMVATSRLPFLGICLGMQLIADRGFEGGENEGIGLIPGEVKKLETKNPAERIPHIGWNEIVLCGDSPLFAGLSQNSDVYFVHSYRFIPKDEADIAAKTPYCGGFVSAIQKGNVFGVQFHPEKSSRTGFQILKNFLTL